MPWECHACGEQHPNIPGSCRACGTKPEIVENVWECRYCRSQGIPASAPRCTTCGKEREAESRFAVDPGRVLDVETGRKLAEGTLVKCAYCEDLIEPFDSLGNPRKSCDTCGASRGEAKAAAVEQTIPAAQAGSYRPMQYTDSSPAQPPHPGTPARSWQEADALADELEGPPGGVVASPGPFDYKRATILGGIGLGGLVLLLWLGGMLIQTFRAYTVDATVTSKRWERAISVERHTIIHDTGWASQKPSGAWNVSCQQKQHGNRKVTDGWDHVPATVWDPCDHRESYVDRESYTVYGQKTCSSYSYVTQGKVSVKTCSNWSTPMSTAYRDVRKTRCVGANRSVTRDVERYHYEPVWDSYCSWSADGGWRYHRTLTTSGGVTDDPQWPEVTGLADEERPSTRTERYIVVVQGDRLDPAQQVEIPESAWRMLSVGGRLRLWVRRGSIVSVVN